MPVRRSRVGRPEFLLIQTRSKPGFWTFPKGAVEPGESPLDAALRETLEESGVLGQASRVALGDFSMHGGGSSKRLSSSGGVGGGAGGSKVGPQKKMRMWLLHVGKMLPDDDPRWLERGKRDRKWFDADGARQALRAVVQSGRTEVGSVFERAVAEMEK